MRRTNLIVALGLLGAVAAGAGLWLWERQRQAPPAKESAERLLIGFSPARVRRVRIRVAGHTLDRQRRQGRWSPVPGRPDSGAVVRLDVILRRLATLRARPLPARSAASGGGDRAAPGEVAAIDVWRGRARPLRLRFFWRGRRLTLRTSDRPGLYAVDEQILELLRREVRRGGQAPALTASSDEIASIRVQQGDKTTTLVRRGGRWFVEDGGALAPAEPAATGRLLRELLGLRITHRLGRGKAAQREHVLERPKVAFTVDDGQEHRLAFGGACPKDPASRIAVAGKDPPEVVCVTPISPKAYAARFASNRLFNLGPDEVKAVSVIWGSRTLALMNRPGRGGWTLISPTERPVDSGAARSLLESMTRLRGSPVSAEQIMPPPGARSAGTVKLTPFSGSPERVDLWAAGRENRPRWARLAGGGRWLELAAADAWLLTADPVSLRSRTICHPPPERVLSLSRAGLGGRTEVIRPDGATWQLVLLDGYHAHRKALGYARNIHQYQDKTRVERNRRGRRWTAPVVLVTEADRRRRGSLFRLLSALRAEVFVSAAARRDHGFGRRPLRLSFRYHHSCPNGDPGSEHEHDHKSEHRSEHRSEHKPTRCKVGLCRVEFGASAAGGGCYGRTAGEDAVFRAPDSLCKRLRRPLVRPQVTAVPLHTLQRIELRTGHGRLVLERQASGQWRPRRRDRADEGRPGKGRPGGQKDPGMTLLFLAPLAARRVESYSGRSPGKPSLWVVLRSPKMPPVRLRFYPPPAGGGGFRVIRDHRPVRYEVPARPVQRLIALVKGDAPR